MATWRVNDSKVLAAMQSEGALGPPSVLVRSRGATLDMVMMRAQEKLRRWHFDGYDLDMATVTLRLARSDDFTE